ncbi:hypothetical protein F0562_005979 [Nyssa sinensis]|uniref:Thioesterase domain-containing protein n=1 Tax=Nyssa sinensis TaxID=561372 RepID=A0A5J5ANB1_9ASTE|nr:hypothetical protein F0562_005979 [Nyssa sinensis]
MRWSPFPKGWVEVNDDGAFLKWHSEGSVGDSSVSFMGGNDPWEIKAIGKDVLNCLEGLERWFCARLSLSDQEEIEIEAKALRVGKAIAVISVELRKKKTGKIIAQGRHTKYLAVSSKM